MSSAANHRKRSHRSQKGHFMAGAAQYRDRVLIDQRKHRSVPAAMARRFGERKNGNAAAAAKTAEI